MRITSDSGRLRPFLTRTRSLTLAAPTTDAGTLADAAVSLLDRVELDRPVRLLGVRLASLDHGAASSSSSDDVGQMALPV